MTDFLIGALVIWFAGYLFLHLRGFNLGRLTLNNIAPGETYRATPRWWRSWKKDLGSTTDPTCLTEVGREYRKRSIQNERVKLFWLLLGFLLSFLFWYFQIQFR